MSSVTDCWACQLLVYFLHLTAQVCYLLDVSAKLNCFSCSNLLFMYFTKLTIELLLSNTVS